jgi:hypothetical protein
LRIASETFVNSLKSEFFNTLLRFDFTLIATGTIAYSMPHETLSPGVTLSFTS